MKKFVTVLLVLLSITSISHAINNESLPSSPKITDTTNVANIVQSESKTESPSINSDRFENYNRNAYRFNSALDKHILRPTAVGYVHYVPSPFRTAIANFYNNLRDFVTLGNDILQLNGTSTMSNVMRISLNSTFGIFGIIDIASSIGIVEEKNTFGNTLRYYGWTHSSYYVIPILGPSTVRDAVGLIPDIVFNPTWYLIQDEYISVSLFTLNAIDTRTKFLGVDQLLDTSIDPYSTLRDTYLSSIGESIPQVAASNDNNPSIDQLLDSNSSSTKLPTESINLQKNESPGVLP